MFKRLPGLTVTLGSEPLAKVPQPLTSCPAKMLLNTETPGPSIRLERAYLASKFAFCGMEVKTLGVRSGPLGFVRQPGDGSLAHGTPVYAKLGLV